MVATFSVQSINRRTHAETPMYLCILGLCILLFVTINLQLLLAEHVNKIWYISDSELQFNLWENIINVKFVSFFSAYFVQTFLALRNILWVSFGSYFHLLYHVANVSCSNISQECQQPKEDNKLITTCQKNLKTKLVGLLDISTDVHTRFKVRHLFQWKWLYLSSVYWSHSSTLKMKVAGSLQMLVSCYQRTLLLPSYSLPCKL